MNQITVVVDLEILELSKNYVRNRLLQMAELTNAVKTHDLTFIAGFAHSMKGSGGAYEMQPLSDFAVELERAVKKEDFGAIEFQVGAIQDYLMRVSIVAKPA